MKHLLLIAFAFGCVWVNAQDDTTEHIIGNRKNSLEQQQKPYVILISADGFRYDYAVKYNARNLLSFSKSGVRAASMIPSYPSLTFPNHYSIVTGLYPAHNGLVGNTFYDRTTGTAYSMNNKALSQQAMWYGGTPLWVLAEHQHMLSASFYWVASDVKIQDTYPTYYFKYNEKIPIEKRIETVRRWLTLPDETRPHFITFYFPEVDHYSHLYGTNSMETSRAVHYVDSCIGLLNETARSTGLPVNFIFVSDHGMADVDTVNMLSLPRGIDYSKFVINEEGCLVSLYAKNKKDIAGAYSFLKQQQKDYKVYLRTNTPKEFHYRSTDDRYNRLGDILIIPTYPKVFNSSNKKMNRGKHGYPPSRVKEMHATFYAWGPAFRGNQLIPSFPNVDVYPFIQKILGLHAPGEKTDGTLKILRRALK